MKILKKIKDDELLYKKEIFDVDLALDLDRKYQQYKKQVQETAIYVDRFWIELSKKEFEVQNLITMGAIIVDNYLITKNLYDDIVSKRTDFKDLV